MPENTPRQKPVKQTVRKKNSKPKHVVVFQDEEGNVLKTSFVIHGESAIPPHLPAKKGEEEHYLILFDHWDTDYSKVEENLVIKPLYRREPKKYLVMYFHENGSMLGMESVAYGSAAAKPCHPEKDSDDQYDYPFLGWNCSLDHISGDTNAKAIFGKVRRVFEVHFYHEDGSLLKTEKVHYDESAHPPVNVTRQPDPLYHYEFAGWSYPTDHIRESLNIHAVFEYIYNEYSITFYDGEDLIEQHSLHYGDEVVYPELSRKGYELIWDNYVDKVSGDQEIRASWLFSNPVGRTMDTPLGRFEILNPSIHRGTVRCLSFQSSGERRVKVPESVRLGDYYYDITEIDQYAFASCRELETLILPDTIRTIHDLGLAGCRSLKKVVLGKCTSRLGKAVFADDVRLRLIEIPCGQMKSVHKDVFLRSPRYIDIKYKNKSKKCIDKCHFKW